MVAQLAADAKLMSVQEVNEDVWVVGKVQGLNQGIQSLYYDVSCSGGHDDYHEIVGRNPQSYGGYDVP